MRQPRPGSLVHAREKGQVAQEDLVEHRGLGLGIGLSGATAEKGAGFLKALAKAYVELDCSLAEIKRSRSAPNGPRC